MGKSGVGKMKIWANTDIFSLFMLIILIIMVALMIVDIYGLHKSNKQFGSAKFKVMIKTRKRLRNVLILLVLDTIFVLGIFLKSPDMLLLFSCFMILIITLIQGFHYKAANGIGENGILHWGIYHSWKDVKSHKIENETVLEIKVLCKSCGFKYNNEIKFDFDKKTRMILKCS